MGAENVRNSSTGRRESSVHEFPSELSDSSPVKNQIDESDVLESPYLTAFEAKYLVLRLTGFFVSCLIGICLIIQAASCNGHCRLFAAIANTNLATFSKLNKNHDAREDLNTSLSNNLNITKFLNGSEITVDPIETITSGSMRYEQELRSFEIPIDETTLSPTQETPTRSYSLSTESTPKETTKVTSTVSEGSLNDRSRIIGAPTNGIVDVLRKLTMLEMPRVAKKLKGDDNIPRTFMETAMHKKDQTTPTIVAQGFSLKELKLKTPESTIIPWSDPN